MSARLLWVLLLLPLLAACSGENRLTIHTSDRPVHFNIEIADDDQERAQGLMYRQQMADDVGMLFDFGEERNVSFWMKNTFIPLDMIFITADGTIARIHQNARPHDTTGISSEGPVRFVLEINGGLSTSLGIAAGDRVEHPRMGQNP